VSVNARRHSPFARIAGLRLWGLMGLMGLLGLMGLMGLLGAGLAGCEGAAHQHGGGAPGVVSGVVLDTRGLWHRPQIPSNGLRQRLAKLLPLSGSFSQIDTRGQHG